MKRVAEDVPDTMSFEERHPTCFVQVEREYTVTSQSIWKEVRKVVDADESRVVARVRGEGALPDGWDDYEAWPNSWHDDLDTGGGPWHDDWFDEHS
ncbi:MAG: hypothetical protein U9M98_00935 [Patescibacteria group bacterium]|nr:hypothetical protein [Patescibacteria group bacterium]